MKISVLFALVYFFSLISLSQQGHSKPVVTIITGLWDVKRGDLQSDAKRTFQYYLSYFRQLLQTQSNLIIFGDNNLKSFVQRNRKKNNTVFILKDLKWFDGLWHTPYIFRILDRLKQKQIDHFNTFKGQPQYGIPYYNVVVMSKTILMKEALEYDIFDSQYFLWADAGITHVVNKRHVASKNNALQRVALTYQTPFFFQTHNNNLLKYGFKNQGEQYLIGNKREFVWANFLGGRIETVSTVHSIYQNILRITFENYDMWVDESVFSIMVDRYPYVAATLFNFTFDKFDTFKFSSPQYFPLQETRFFTFNVINSSVLCTESVQKRNIFILKQTQFEGGIRERMQYKFRQEVLTHTKDNLDYHYQFVKSEIIQNGLICLYLLGIFLYIRKSYNQMNKITANQR